MHPRTRNLLVVVGIAAGALAAGVFAGTRITSPADAAARAEPPEASDVTVPVELRGLRSQVVTRGDVSYTGAVNVELQFPGMEAAPVVTGGVPDVGDTVRRGDVVLEVVGRPVIVLPGDVPMYRSLRPGMAGPDVEQLEKALNKLGFDPGEVDDEYTASTSRAVEELFQHKGYEAPAVDAEIQAELDAAEDGLDMAEDEVRNAEAALDAAEQGPGEADKIQAQHEVDVAERQLEQAKASADDEADDEAVEDAEVRLEVARANLEELLDGPDISAERSAAQAARERLAEAQHARDEAAAQAGTPLPASEVVFVPSLPRRVDEVNVARGDEVDGAVMSISGTDMAVTVNVDAAGRELLEEGMDATVEVPTGDHVTAPITDIREASGEDASGYDIRIALNDLNKKQVEALRSANVKVTIPVASTDGEVLAVPLAALTAGTGGEARVEVQRSSDGDADGGPATELVEVEVGLTAQGYAEVAPIEEDALQEGDLVVVGNEGASSATDAPAPEDDREPENDDTPDDDRTPGDEATTDEPA